MNKKAFRLANYELDDSDYGYSYTTTKVIKETIPCNVYLYASPCGDLFEIIPEDITKYDVCEKYGNNLATYLSFVTCSDDWSFKPYDNDGDDDEPLELITATSETVKNYERYLIPVVELITTGRCTEYRRNFRIRDCWLYYTCTDGSSRRPKWQLFTKTRVYSIYILAKLYEFTLSNIAKHLWWLQCAKTNCMGYDGAYRPYNDNIVVFYNYMAADEDFAKDVLIPFFKWMKLDFNELRIEAILRRDDRCTRISIRDDDENEDVDFEQLFNELFEDEWGEIMYELANELYEESDESIPRDLYFKRLYRTAFTGTIDKDYAYSNEPSFYKLHENIDDYMLNENPEFLGGEMKSKKRTIILVIVVIAVVGSVIGLIIYFVTHDNDEEGSVPSSPPSI